MFDRKQYNFEYQSKNRSYFRTYGKNYYYKNDTKIKNNTSNHYKLNKKKNDESYIANIEHKLTTIKF